MDLHVEAGRGQIAAQNGRITKVMHIAVDGGFELELSMGCALSQHGVYPRDVQQIKREPTQPPIRWLSTTDATCHYRFWASFGEPHTL